MSKPAVNQFINASELYLRLTEKDRSALNIDEIDQLIYSENGAITENSEFSYHGYVVIQMNNPCSK
ncbi:MAG: hypothetical protein DHS20C09_21530 [marine bacterium B5-7]|nr:MAG: hypothetical protein DHS20C09_21530 [marine bacterium B5-7]